MKLSFTQKRVNYKGIIFLVIIIAAFAALAVERILYRIAGETEVLSLYKELISITTEDRKEFFCYLLTKRLKQTFCLIVLAFTVAGFPIHVLMFFQQTYYYLFFVAAMYHNRNDLEFILCIPVVLIWFLFCLPVYGWCIKTSLESFQSCLKNGKGIHYDTKYQLQTEVKIGIIILVYVALGAAVDSVVCTYFLQAVF